MDNEKQKQAVEILEHIRDDGKEDKPVALTPEEAELITRYVGLLSWEIVRADMREALRGPDVQGVN